MARWLKILSDLTCSCCGYTQTLRMPKYATKVTYECPKCKTVMATEKSNCCVFCTYGTEPCPKQQSKNRILSLHEDEETEF